MQKTYCLTNIYIMTFKPKQRVRYGGSYHVLIPNSTEELDDNGYVVRREVMVESTSPAAVETAPIEKYSLSTLINAGQPLKRIPTDVLSPSELSEIELAKIADSIPDFNQVDEPSNE